MLDHREQSQDMTEGRRSREAGDWDAIYRQYFTPPVMPEEQPFKKFTLYTEDAITLSSSTGEQHSESNGER